MLSDKLTIHSDYFLVRKAGPREQELLLSAHLYTLAELALLMSFARTVDARTTA